MQVLLAGGVVGVVDGFPGGASGQESASSAGGNEQETRVQSLGWEDPLEEEYPLQHSCLEIPMDRGARRAAVHGAEECQTWQRQENPLLWVQPSVPALGALNPEQSSCFGLSWPPRPSLLVSASPGLPLICVHGHPSPVWNLSPAHCRPCTMLLLFLPQSMPQSRCLTHTCWMSPAEIRVPNNAISHTASIISQAFQRSKNI